MNTNLSKARAAKARAAEVFGALLGEVSVGVMKLADDQFGLKVNLTEKPAAGVSLPKEVAGVPVTIEVVGRIRKR